MPRRASVPWPPPEGPIALALVGGERAAAPGHRGGCDRPDWPPSPSPLPAEPSPSGSGELVGIGEPSSVTETNLRDPRLNSQDLVGPVLVAASGTIPDTDQSFEIVAWAARKKLPVLSPKEQDALRALSRLERANRRELPWPDRRALLEQTARVINLWRTKLSEAEWGNLVAFMQGSAAHPGKNQRGARAGFSSSSSRGSSVA